MNAIKIFLALLIVGFIFSVTIVTQAVGQFQVWKEFPETKLNDINSLSQVAGCRVANGVKRAFFFDAYSGVKVLEADSEVLSLSEMSVCVGRKNSVAFWWEPQRGKEGLIMITGAATSRANSVNLNGIIVGEALVGKNTKAWWFNKSNQKQGLLNPLPGDTSSRAVFINSFGWAFGQSWKNNEKKSMAVVWDVRSPSQAVQARLLNGPKNQYSSVLGSSDSRSYLAVGFFMPNNENEKTPCYWLYQTGEQKKLSLGNGFFSAAAMAINRFNVIVGSCFRETRSYGCLWASPGAPMSVVDIADGYMVKSLKAINLYNWIVCQGEKNNVSYGDH